VNAAKDSTDLVAKLRAYHHAAQNAPAGDPKKVLLRYGLDLVNGDVRDNVVAGVLEPTMSKVRSLKSAYEAAISLLRIDDAIQCVPGKRLPFHPEVCLTDPNRAKAGSRLTWPLIRDSLTLTVLYVIHTPIMLTYIEKYAIVFETDRKCM
jgi:hypothetical protein